jgi:hypothetical protein
MTTGDWALIISLCSFAVALGSFIWNVWSKFIYPKPRVRVSFTASIIFHPGHADHKQEFLSLGATNLGPGDVILHSAVLRSRKRKWWRGWKGWYRRVYRFDYGMLNPLEGFPARMDHTIGPFSGGLPKKLAFAETFSSYFPHKVDWFENKVWGVGFSDSFGRNHWCSRQDVKKVRDAVLNETKSDAAQIRPSDI